MKRHYFQQLFVLLCTIGICYCDRRVQEDISSADTSALLRSIQAMEVKQFVYKYPQFYNPVFGEKQIGFVAQELAEVPDLPQSAIGRVKKRTVEKDVHLEDLHVVNQDAIFIANVGATQEIIKRMEFLSKDLRKLAQELESSGKSSSGSFEAVEENLAELSAKLLRAKVDVSQLSEELGEKQKLAVMDVEARMLRDMESIHTRMQTLLDAGVQQLQKEIDTANSQAGKAITKVEMTEAQIELSKETVLSLKAKLNEVAEEVVSARADLRVNAGGIQANHAALASVGRELLLVQMNVSATNNNLASLQSKWEMTESTVAEAVARSSAAEKDMLQVDQRVSDLEARTAAVQGDTASIQLSFTSFQEEASARIEKALETLDAHEKRHSSTNKDIHDIQQQLDDLKSEFKEWKSTTEAGISRADKAVEELRLEVNRSAAQETFERRRIAEAEVELAKARVEEIRVRAEEERRNARVMAEVDLAKQQRFNNESVARVREEEAVRKDAEMAILAFRQNLTLEQEREKAEQEKELETLRSKSMLDRAELQKDAQLAQARIEAEMETLRERENHDIRLNVTKLKADENRRSRIAAIQTAAEEMRKSLALAVSSPRNMCKSFEMDCTTSSSVMSDETEGAVYLRKRIEALSMKPTLIRETSRRNLLYKFLFQRVFSTQRPTESSNVGIEVALQDVVLSPPLKSQMQRIALSAKAAFERKAPLRHIMLHGPPGTGKTMAAKRIAKWCGLEYAIMSGADVAPLQNDAVTELHKLFRWASRTKQGVLLFIDEADAFLSSRASSRQSEAMRSALTALLYHTGETSSKLMLVLTTNRPMDIDVAVLDRIDESVEFPTPNLRERELLVQQYYYRLAAPVIDCASKEMLRSAASRTAGFSGREIAKLMASLQTHLHAMLASVSEGGAVKGRARAVFEQVVSAGIKQHRQLKHAKGGSLDISLKSTNQQDTP